MRPRRILCYGDSLAIHWPGVLQRLRPDLRVSGAALVGDTAANVGRLESALARGRYDTVVIHIGINDPLDASVSDPGVTFARVRRLVARARAHGADVLVLTLLPTTRVRPPRPAFDFDRFARGVSRRIMTRWGRGCGRVRAGDLRTPIQLIGIDRLSGDGLHPNDAGNRIIARFVSRLLS